MRCFVDDSINNFSIYYITVPPFIEEQQTEFIVIQDSNIILPCRASGMPSPEISWEKDGKKISPSNFQYRILRSGWLAIPITRLVLYIPTLTLG